MKRSTLFQRIMVVWVSLCMMLTLAMPAPVVASDAYAEEADTTAPQPARESDDSPTASENVTVDEEPSSDEREEDISQAGESQSESQPAESQLEAQLVETTVTEDSEETSVSTQEDMTAQADVAFDESGSVTVTTAEQLFQAVDEAPDKATIYLGADIVLDRQLNINNTNTLTINLNSHVLSRKLDNVENQGSVISVGYGTTLYITDNFMAEGKICGGKSFRGGGIDNFGTLVIVGGEISGNQGVEGGGIFNVGELSMTNCYILNNEALRCGGGVMNAAEGKVSAIGCKINENTTKSSDDSDYANAGNGGGVLNECTMTLRDCTIQDNSAAYGAGVSNRFDSTLNDGRYEATVNISNCDISNNKASKDGGGVYALSGFKSPSDTKVSVTIEKNTRIQGNTSTNGAGLYIEKDCIALLRDSTVSNNTSVSSGGGIYSRGTLQMSGAPVVMDNYLRSQKQDDLDMGSGQTIHIVDSITDGAHVAWRVSNSMGQQVITTDYGKFNGDKDAGRFFFPYGDSKFYYGHTAYTGVDEAYVGANVPYLDEKGNTQTCYNYTELLGNDQKAMVEGWYVSRYEGSMSDRASVNGHVRIIIAWNSSISFKKGITVEEGNTLSIYGQPEGEGKLIANGDTNNAGIGSTYNKMPGDINIYGGNIEANGGRFGAGIGGGINDSTHYNTGGYSTDKQPTATLHIYGGTVTAKGGEFAAGIGGGQRMSNPHIVIDGGTVVARGTNQGAGIGGGGNAPIWKPIEINGGTVTAVGGGGAGIGAGYNTEPLASSSVHGPIILRGGFIKASSDLSYAASASCGAGIGGGAYERQIGSSYVHNVDVFDGKNGQVIMCGAVVEATGKYGSSPLGGGTASRKQLAIRLNYSSDKPDESMDYMVKDGNGKRVLAGDRVATCRDSSFARLEPCDHADYSLDTSTPGKTILSCKYCGHVGEVYMLTFEPGEGKGTAFTKAVSAELDVELPDETAFESPDGAKKLVGWKIGDTVYKPKEKVRITRDSKAVAQWTITWAGLQQFINNSTSRDNRLYLTNDVVATDKDTTLVVPSGKNVRISLQGYSINRNVAEAREDGTVIKVEGSLTIDSRINEDASLVTGGNTSKNGGGVHVASGGYFRLFGGQVTKNQAAKGGGVYVENGGTLELSSGKIISNSAIDGGGVYLDGGTCTMDGGDILENRATENHGGGVYVNGGQLEMRYGSISKNVANRNGGAVMLQYGIFEMTHGNLRDNSAGTYGGGIYASKEATCSMSGYLSIRDNRAGRNKGAGNVYLPTGAYINVIGTLDPYEPIGITTQTRPAAGKPVVVTSGFRSLNVKKCFTSESSAYAVGRNEQGEAILGVSATVSFVAGIGSGEMKAETVVSGSEYKLPKCEFEGPEGYEFLGWLVNGQGEAKAVGSGVVIARNTTLTAVWSKSYELWVKNVQVTEANRNDILGDGTARYDEQSRTLVLNGFHASGDYRYGAMIAASNMDLTVTGNGTIAGETRAVYVDEGNLTIGGDFTIHGQIRPVQASRHTVTFTHGNIVITGNGMRAGIGISASDLVVQNGVKRLQIDADTPISSGVTSNIGEDLEIKIPKGGKIKKGEIIDANGNSPSLQVVIAPAIKPAFRTHTIALDGMIGVRFFMELPDIEGCDWKESRMDFAVGGKGAFQTSDSFDPDDKNEAGTYYTFTCYVDSIQMAEPISATFRYVVNGEERSISQTYSVTQYISDFKAKEGQFDKKIVDLVHALADYGHYMQVYLSNLRKWEIGKDYARIDAATQFDASIVAEARKGSEQYRITAEKPQDGEFGEMGFSLDLEAATSIYLYAYTKGDASVVSASLSDGTQLEIQKVGKLCWRVTIPRIMAHQLGKIFDVSITTSGGSTARVHTAALSFAEMQLRNRGFEEHVTEFFAAASIYRYYAAAKAYLE